MHSANQPRHHKALREALISTALTWAQAHGQKQPIRFGLHVQMGPWYQFTFSPHEDYPRSQIDDAPLSIFQLNQHMRAKLARHIAGWFADGYTFHEGLGWAQNLLAYAEIGQAFQNHIKTYRRYEHDLLEAKLTNEYGTRIYPTPTYCSEDDER